MAGMTLEGKEQVLRTLQGMSHRATGIEPVGIPIFHELALAEETLFARLHGRYVRTGRTKASLTTVTGQDAVRRVGQNYVEFGTSVWYAIFLRRTPTKGQARKGAHLGRSAVLVSVSTAKRRAGQVVLRYIAEGRL